MTVKLYALTCGFLTGPFDAMMEEARDKSTCRFRPF
jgi:hypothetical protein